MSKLVKIKRGNMRSKIFKAMLIIMFSTFIYDSLPAEESLATAQLPVSFAAMQVNPDNTGGHHRRWWRRHHRRCHRRRPWRW